MLIVITELCGVVLVVVIRLIVVARLVVVVVWWLVIEVWLVSIPGLVSVARLVVVTLLVVAWLHITGLNVVCSCLNCDQRGVHWHFSSGNFRVGLQPVWRTAHTTIAETIRSPTCGVTAIATGKRVSEHFFRFAAPVPTETIQQGKSSTDPTAITPPTVARQALTHRY